MSFVFVDRESSYPNRYLVTPDSGNPYYVVLTRADEPIVAGTPLNAETFNALTETLLAIAQSTNVLPTVTVEDNGKFLRVVDGAWSVVTISSYNGEMEDIE